MLLLRQFIKTVLTLVVHLGVQWWILLSAIDTHTFRRLYSGPPAQRGCIESSANGTFDPQKVLDGPTPLPQIEGRQPLAELSGPPPAMPTPCYPDTIDAFYGRLLPGAQLLLVFVLGSKLAIRTLQHFFKKRSSQVHMVDGPPPLQPPALAGPWQITPATEPHPPTPRYPRSFMRFFWPFAARPPFPQPRFPSTHNASLSTVGNNYSPVLVQVPLSSLQRNPSRFAYFAHDFDYDYFYPNGGHEFESTSSPTTSSSFSHLSRSFSHQNTAHVSRPPLKPFLTINPYSKPHMSSPQPFPRSRSFPNLRPADKDGNITRDKFDIQPLPAFPQQSERSLSPTQAGSGGAGRKISTSSSTSFIPLPPGLGPVRVDSEEHRPSSPIPSSESMRLPERKSERDSGSIPRSISFSALRRSLHLPKKLGKQRHT